MKDLMFAVWKPVGMSSNYVLNRIRRILDSKRVGHAGTLDPLAQGVLVVASGKCTKSLSVAESSKKIYLGDIHLGATSTTDDAEGTLTPGSEIESPDIHKIDAVVAEFVGSIVQRPPIFSALKVSGKRAYRLAREGKEFKLEPRPAHIYRIDIVSYEWPHLIIRIECAKGVYIRALARDIGEKLKTGGYLAGLIRERVGEYRREDCVSYEELEQYLLDARGVVY